MKDVQSSSPSIALDIDCVGVRNIKLPLLVRDREHGTQHTVASVDLGVDLPSEFKGTHMSRFIEALEEWNEEVGHGPVRRLLDTTRQRLGAKRAWVRFSFPYFMTKKAPVSGIPATISYDCKLMAESSGEKLCFLLELSVPVMTVCPCSKAISKEGAHSQRAVIHMQIRLKEFSWLEEFIEIAERSGSCAVHTLLKREDEKFVTEYAFARPAFVEDVVRAVAQEFSRHPHISWFRVEVESAESIHNHDAFAYIERELNRTEI